MTPDMASDLARIDELRIHVRSILLKVTWLWRVPWGVPIPGDSGSGAMDLLRSGGLGVRPMMKKRGFTLAEMIAAIALLAVSA